MDVDESNSLACLAVSGELFRPFSVGPRYTRPVAVPLCPCLHFPAQMTSTCRRSLLIANINHNHYDANCNRTRTHHGPAVQRLGVPRFALPSLPFFLFISAVVTFDFPSLQMILDWPDSRENIYTTTKLAEHIDGQSANCQLHG